MGFVFPDHYHLLLEVNPDPDAKSPEFELRLDPGRTIEVTTIGPEGGPIGGTVVKGIADSELSEFPRESPTFKVHALDPSAPRRLTVIHDGRKLSGSVYLKGDEAGPITLALSPWGTIVGRALDDEGNPAKYRRVGPSYGTPSPRSEEVGVLPGWKIGGIPVNNDGRFRIEGLVAGLKYTAIVTGDDGRGDLFKNVTVGPGEVKDLGDIKARPLKP